MKHFRKKGITKKYYKRKSHQFTKKKHGGVGRLLKLLGVSALSANAFVPNHRSLHHNSALTRQEKSQLQPSLTNTPYSISSKVFEPDIQPSSNGNKSPPKTINTPKVYLDDGDNDDNDNEDYFIHLNENGILELEGALRKLGLHPENIIDILKAISKSDKRFSNINKFTHEYYKKVKNELRKYPKLTKEQKDEIEKDIFLSLYKEYSSRKK